MTLLREVRLDSERQRSAPPAPRALAVDALRGLAILGMVLVAVEPLGVLPAWMYHAQTPPPTHEMNTGLPGLTWPDLVFPFFIFTLGVAIPLALSRRLDAGVSRASIALSALSRGALLVFFALFRQHFDASLSGLMPETTAWLWGLAAFAVLFLVFVRLPDSWSRPVRLAARVAGWAGAAAMFAFVRFPDGSGFRPERIDIILLLLAYCAVLGTLVWMATRHNLLARLGVLAIVVSLWIAGDTPGWIAGAHSVEPVPWLYKFVYLRFLCAVIPGTIVGDMLLEWTRRQRDAESATALATGQAILLACLAALFVPVVLAGVQARQLLATTAVSALLGAAMLFLARRPLTATEMLNASLVRWGLFWLLIGLVLDPYGGGTKKVPETLGWFFQGCGLAVMALIFFIVVTEVFKKPRAVQLLIDNGQNPMVAYVSIGMLVQPLLGLTGAKALVESTLSSPARQFAWSVALLLAAALIVQQCTRRRWLWRS